MPCDLDPRISANLRNWRQSGAAFLWVDAHRGQWNHQDWLDLLAQLPELIPGALEPDAIGLVLERVKVEWCNLRRWRALGEPARWVAGRRGRWDHEDWLTLLRGLRKSEFWPLDRDRLGLVLEEAKVNWHNLQRWQQSGEPLRWVSARHGRWDHNDWLNLVQTLQQSSFWPLDTDAVGLLLEGNAREWRNLRHWKESGVAQRWVVQHHGSWSHNDWLTLLGTLQWSGLWPIDIQAVAEVLEELRHEVFNADAGRTNGQSGFTAPVNSRPADHMGLQAFLRSRPGPGPDRNSRSGLRAA